MKLQPVRLYGFLRRRKTFFVPNFKIVSENLYMYRLLGPCESYEKLHLHLQQGNNVFFCNLAAKNCPIIVLYFVYRKKTLPLH